MKQLSKNLVGGAALMLVTAAGAGTAVAATFTVDDIVNNQIRFDYNTLDNTHYLNGANTGKTLAETVDSMGGVQVANWGNAAALLATSGAATTSQSFVYSFILPADTYISGLSVKSALLVGPGSSNNNYLRLYVSTTGTGDWTAFNTLQSVGNGAWADSNTTENLTAHVVGATRYYIKGVFDFTAGTGTDYLDTLQMFRTYATGDAGSMFQNTISVVPEPASLALLLGVGGLLAVRRRR